MRKGSGVNLVEFLIVLAVICILTALAIPSFVNLVRQHRLTGTAETLYNTLQYARSEAIKRNTTVYVYFQTGDTWCYGVNAGATCNCATAGNCGLGAVSYPKAQDITFSTTGLTSSAIQFEGTHGAANVSGSSITMTLYGQTKLIKINIGALGNLQMCSTGIDGYTAC